MKSNSDMKPEYNAEKCAPFVKESLENMQEDSSFLINLQKLIDLLRVLTEYLLNNKMTLFNESVKELSDLLGAVFPVLISSFTKPGFQDVAGDTLYWSEQLGKIVSVLKEEDQFKKIDTLYYETRENLVKYQRMITERGIII